jgi:UPF0755 protein
MFEMTEINEQESKKPAQKIITYLLGIVIVGLLGLLMLSAYVYTLNKPPVDSDVPLTVTIEPGMTIKTIARQLEEEGIVRSGSLLYFVTILFFEPMNIKASSYVFDEPLTTYEIAHRLTLGDFDSDLVRLTHIEGERVLSIARRAAEVLKNFDEAGFVQLAEGSEGTLYPETYFIPADFSAAELYELMTETFATTIRPLAAEIEAHPLTLDEILTLASIIEREANSETSMKMVSGILQNRLTINMPLQADASIEYILDKPLQELVPEDLEIDSPYNTYLYRGLPPTPIGNPGLTAIKAVLQPTESEFFFYLTDEAGDFYYAVTYDEHLDNIERYLR